MIGLVNRSIAASTAEYLALGPVPRGTVVRDVWLLLAAAGVAAVQVGVSVCRNSEESLVNYESGSSLVRSDASFAGSVAFRSFFFSMLANTTFGTVVPVYVVGGGDPIWLVLEVFVNTLVRATAGLRVDFDRGAWPSETVRGTPEVGRGNGRILEELRSAADFARGA